MDEVEHSTTVTLVKGVQPVADIRCECGWTQRVCADSRMQAQSKAAAQARAHRKGRVVSGTEMTTGAMLVGLPIVLLVLAVPVILVVALAVRVAGGEDDDSPPDRQDTSVSYEDSEDDADYDCDAAVTYLMTEEYGGGWGSGNWPESEYPDRVAQCEWH